VSSPTFHRVYKGNISEVSQSGNPIIYNDDWDEMVVIVTNDEDEFSKGETVKFVVKQKRGEHYQALLSHQAPVTKPKYRSKAVIPIHHDGKHNQSVGDTRSESHAMRSIDDRS